MRKYIILILFFNLSAENIPKLETDRPDVTESSHAVEENYYQIEANLTNYVNNENGVNWDGPSINFKKGIAESRDLQFVFSTYSESEGKAQNFYDLGLRLKQELVEDESLAIGLLPFIISPELEQDLEFGFALPTEFVLSDTFSISVMPQFSHYLGELNYLQTVAFGADLSDKFGCFTEFVLLKTEANPEEYLFNYGITYLLTPAQQLDLAVNHSVEREERGITVLFGYSAKFAA